MLTKTQHCGWSSKWLSFLLQKKYFPRKNPFTKIGRPAAGEMKDPANPAYYPASDLLVPLWSLNFQDRKLITSIDCLKLNPRKFILDEKTVIIFSQVEETSIDSIIFVWHYPHHHTFPLKIGLMWWFLTPFFVSSLSKLHISASGDPPVCVDGVCVEDFLAFKTRTGLVQTRHDKREHTW